MTKLTDVRPNLFLIPSVLKQRLSPDYRACVPISEIKFTMISNLDVISATNYAPFITLEIVSVDITFKNCGLPV